MQGIPSLNSKGRYEPNGIYDEFIGAYSPTEQAMVSLIWEKLSFVRNQKNILEELDPR